MDVFCVESPACVSLAEVISSAGGRGGGLIPRRVTSFIKGDASFYNKLQFYA